MIKICTESDAAQLNFSEQRKTMPVKIHRVTARPVSNIETKWRLSSLYFQIAGP